MSSNPASTSFRETAFSDFARLTPNSTRDIRNGQHKASHSNTNSKSQSATNRTTRLACDICRERKVRCDKAEPKCSRCDRLNYECRYQGPTKYRAAQADLPRQVSELQERLAEAEAILTPFKSSTASRDRNCNAEPPWHIVPSPNMHADFDNPCLAPGPMPDFEGFDTFDNLIKEAEWSADWAPMATPVSNTLPIQEFTQFHEPMELGSLSNGRAGSIQHDFGSPSLSSGKSTADEEVSFADLALLHHNYFETFYPVLPILSQPRFFRELSERSSSFAIRSLSYAVALVGSTLSPRYARMRQSCYSKARECVELCERDESGIDLAGPNIFQALLFIIRYELTSRQITRAWMTLSRAITLAKLLNVHQMDSRNSVSSDADFRLPILTDLSILEEMRRSFWALYIFESYASIRIRRPCQLSEVQILVYLPSPGKLNDGFIPTHMPFLEDNLELRGTSHFSSYAGIVLMVTLARLCHEHVTLTATDSSGRGFWDRHYALVKRLTECATSMHIHLRTQAIHEDPLAFSLYINFYAVHILLHEAAIQKIGEQGFPQLLAAESRKSCTDAALKISGALRMKWPVQRSENDFFTLQATFIGWPIAMSAKSLSRNLLDFEDTTSMGTADSLRLLLAALDQVEPKDGHWHQASADAAATLADWENKQVRSLE